MKTNTNKGTKMIKIKEFKLDGNWAEVTWVEESIQTSEEGVETTTETQVHCESFSGHPEHITLLRAKAKEFNTYLKEFEPLIKQCEDSFVYPTDAEIAKEELKNKIAEAKAYLNKTDKKFFIGYKPKPDEDLVLIEKLRDEARDFIRANS